ncbi:MAG: transposase [Methylococcales bacterium]
MKNTLITIKQLVSEAQCYEVVRTFRWQGKVSCPHCDRQEIISSDCQRIRFTQR